MLTTEGYPSTGRCEEAPGDRACDGACWASDATASPPAQEASEVRPPPDATPNNGTQLPDPQTPNNENQPHTKALRTPLPPSHCFEGSISPAGFREGGVYTGGALLKTLPLTSLLQGAWLQLDFGDVDLADSRPRRSFSPVSSLRSLTSSHKLPIRPPPRALGCSWTSMTRSTWTFSTSGASTRPTAARPTDRSAGLTCRCDGRGVGQ